MLRDASQTTPPPAALQHDRSVPTHTSLSIQMVALPPVTALRYLSACAAGPPGPPAPPGRGPPRCPAMNGLSIRHDHVDSPPRPPDPPGPPLPPLPSASQPRGLRRTEPAAPRAIGSLWCRPGAAPANRATRAQPVGGTARVGVLQHVEGAARADLDTGARTACRRIANATPRVRTVASGPLSPLRPDPRAHRRTRTCARAAVVGGRPPCS